jgi:hypothetical protein
MKKLLLLVAFAATSLVYGSETKSWSEFFKGSGDKKAQTISVVRTSVTTAAVLIACVFVLPAVAPWVVAAPVVGPYLATAAAGKLTAVSFVGLANYGAGTYLKDDNIGAQVAGATVLPAIGAAIIGTMQDSSN